MGARGGTRDASSHALGTIVTKVRNGYRYVGHAFGWPILWVDPRKVEARAARHQIPLPDRDHVYVARGDWDLDLPAFDAHPLPRAIEDHFLRGVPWAETEYYVTELDLVRRRGRGHNGCRSVEDVQKRWDLLDRIYEDMRDNGYRMLEELGDAATRDLLINVGRHGQLIYETGKHRLSIARVLGIQRVPVRVMVRHQSWFRHALGAIRADTPDELPEATRQWERHPDVVALLSAESVDRKRRRLRLNV